MEKNIVLIGFMGAGKTSVGECLSRLAGAPLADTDRMIEEMAGMSISRIFAEQGEEAFRQTETDVIKELLHRPDAAVISTGGGLPMREENRQCLRRLGQVVYLRVQPETVIERLRGDTARPLLAGDNAAARVRELLALRDPVYREAAHVTVDADLLTPQEIAEKIAAGGI